MAPYVRVLDVATRRYMKPRRADGLVAAGACVWVEPGMSVRTLTLAEMVDRRAGLSRQHEPVPMAELPGLVTVGLAYIRQELALAREGTRLVALAGRG